MRLTVASAQQMKQTRPKEGTGQPRMASERDQARSERDGLTPAELEAEVAEALPERAAMSTVSLTNLDAAAGTVEAVGDGVSDTTAGAAEAVVPAETTEQAGVPAEATELNDGVQQDTALPADATAPEATTTATPDETIDPALATTADPVAAESQGHHGGAERAAPGHWAPGEHPGQGDEHRSAVAAQHAAAQPGTPAEQAAAADASGSSATAPAVPDPPAAESAPVPDLPATGVPAADDAVTTVGESTATNVGAAAGTA